VSFDPEAEADLARCGALKDFWYAACLSEELPRNRPLSRTVFGERLVLFRDPDGRPAALKDRCLHRNARLSAGDVFDGKLGCAYHGWVYDRSGAVVEIPSLGPGQRASGLDDEACAVHGIRRAPSEVGCVPRFDTLEQDGLVYVFMGGDASRARRPAFRIPYFGDPAWTVYFMATEFPNAVTNLVENFMDVPHTSFVHRGWFRKPARRSVPATVTREDGSVLVRYEQEADQLTGLGRLFAVGGQGMEHTDHYFVPNVTRVDYRWGPDSGFAITSQCTPVGPLHSRVYTAISYRLPYDLPRALVARAMMPVVRWYTRQVIVQDVDIMQIQQDGLQGDGAGVFVSTEADLLHAWIEGYRAWLCSGGEGAGPPDDARRIVFWT
jgi:phenylpropionate dioxygenase-like ring-hydroxylating dioxygenase large terminal subunit